MSRYIVILAVLGALYAALVYAPTEATMGDLQRIFYFHVPAAWAGFLSFAVVFVASVQWLRTKAIRWDALAGSSAEVGIVFTSMALITGSLWAKPTWGTWWDWDPRLTSTLILWLVYVSYLMLRSTVDAPSKRASLAAVVGILGFVDVPIVFMSIRWWRTIHPAVLGSGGFEVEGSMLLALLVCLVAFTLLLIHLVRLRLTLELQRVEVLQLRETILEE